MTTYTPFGVHRRPAVDPATIGDRGRAAAGARIEAWGRDNPHRPCAAGCKGGRIETHEGGVLTSVVGCEACRGLGSQPMTLAEIRGAYARARERAYERLERVGTEEDRRWFDDHVRAIISEKGYEPTPGAFLWVARMLEQGRKP